MRKGWIYKDNGDVIEKGTGYLQGRNSNGTMFAPDLPEFRSPIDGKVYSGRAGLREHNKLHNVVNNEELTGLPVDTMNKAPKIDRAAIRESILQIAHQKGYMS